MKWRKPSRKRRHPPRPSLWESVPMMVLGQRCAAATPPMTGMSWSPDARSKRSRRLRPRSGAAEPAHAIDTTREEDVIRLFDAAMTEDIDGGPADLVTYNAGLNRKIDFRQMEVSTFEDFWRTNTLGGFLVGREAARRFVPLGRGSIFFTGASGSLRGMPGFAQFGASKAGLRMISQSMAREFGPPVASIAHPILSPPP